MYKVALLLLLTFFSCTKKKSLLAVTKKNSISVKENTVEKAKNYATTIAHIKSYAKKNGKNQDIAFMIDYSLHSGKNRFFVIDLKKSKIIKKALVCHGSCKNEAINDENATNFSNVSESLCTSLGMAVIGERAYSQWGKNYKYWLDGLETSNSKMRKRVVVLHAWEHVPDKEIYPKPIVMSWGCPTVSIKFLDELDVLLKKHKKVLLYSFD